jgi:hypothetical protein
MVMLKPWMIKELELIGGAESYQPDMEVQAGEEVLGVLVDPNSRKLMVLKASLGERLQSMIDGLDKVLENIERLGATGRKTGGLELATQLSKMNPQAVFLAYQWEEVEELVQRGLREAISSQARLKLESRGGAFQVRRGWKIVLTPGLPNKG